MDKPIRLLIYGTGNVNPINILLQNLRKWGKNSYRVDGLNLYENAQVTEPYEYFDSVYKIERREVATLPFKVIVDCTKKAASTKWFKRQLLKRLLKLRIKEAISFFKSVIQDTYYRQEHIELFNQYDIVNVHWITNERADIISQAPQKCRVVLSFWGSDLMAQSGVENYASLIKAIERADLITMHSIEMREIFLSKFGRQFKNKIRFALFGQRDEIFEYNANDKCNLKKLGANVLQRHKVNVQEFEFILKVGYSGFESLNHLTIIEQCGKLSKEIKEKMLLVIPMTYGAATEYMNTVEIATKKNDLQYCILKNYLTSEEALSLSFVCNIMLNLRDNDAFNNSMIETLFAGNILISGAWLPYSALRKSNVYFHEIFDFKILPQTLTNIFKNFESELARTADNDIKVKNLLNGQYTGSNWDRIYYDTIYA